MYSIRYFEMGNRADNNFLKLNIGENKTVNSLKQVEGESLSTKITYLGYASNTEFKKYLITCKTLPILVDIIMATA